MTVHQTPGNAPADVGEIQNAVLQFLKAKTLVTPATDQDLFSSGVVSSMFAMELVVFLEQSYQVTIVGGDLKIDNFRTVDAMTDLVLRLRDASDT
jgi:methoxymalonate biosynthesis acyl carrier protein